jgi:FkbM family methyltransferase
MNILKCIWESSLSDLYTYLRNNKIFGSFDKKFEIVDLKVAGQHKIKIQTLKSSPEYQAIATGEYESFLIDYIKDAKFNKKNSVIWDLGAHVGYISLVLGSLFKDNGKIVSFEPNINNVDNFKTNLQLNPTLTNIKLEYYAVGRTVGELNFTLSRSKNNPTTMGGFISSALPPLEEEAYKKMGFYTTKVMGITIDEYIKRNPALQPDLLKIDVEGAELEVLHGGIEYLNQYKPILVIEVHHIVLLFKVVSFLESLGYKIALLNEASASPSVCTITAK